MYYDNLSVQNAFLVKNRDLKKQMQFLSDSEKYLLDNLSGDDLTNFKKFSESWNFINNETNREFFTYGFRIGALILMDILNDKTTD